MVEVHLWGALRPIVGGALSVSVEAKDIRELFKKLSAQYPAFEPYLKQGIAVSINGRIYRDTWDEKLPADAEIYLLPRIPGG